MTTIATLPVKPVSPAAPTAEPESTPVAIVKTDDDSNGLTFLSWDTEGAAAAQTNLLRPGQSVHVEAKHGEQWSLAAGVRLAVTPQDGGFDLTLTGAADNDAEALRLVFPLSPRASATTIIPSSYDVSGALMLPAIMTSPQCGQMTVRGPAGIALPSTLAGSRAQQWVDWRIELPPHLPPAGLTLSFRPFLLSPPDGLHDLKRWQQARRAWFNVWQVSASWGNASSHAPTGVIADRAPAGVLANNVISDPVSACLYIYADSALLTPHPAPDISVLPAVAYTVDWFLNERTQDSGQVISYGNYLTFLDSNPSMLIASWDYVEGSGDEKWLGSRLEKLEKVADYLAARDVDSDGIVEAVGSGNAGTLRQPERSSNANDVVNFGHKDAYSNVLIYRAWRCMADLEKRLNRKEQAAKYTALADKLKAAYCKTFYNPQNGWLVGWISLDGARHDYCFTSVNLMAIDYGLVSQQQGRDILKRLREKMQSVGYTRFDIGLPWNLIPIRREDYLQGLKGYGIPQREDGSDTFQQYCNGSAYPGAGFQLIAAHYAVGQVHEGDGVLDAMLARAQHGDVEDGGFACSIVNHYPQGGEFFDWNSKTCGYEGMCSHAWYFAQAVALREPKLRARLYRPLLSHSD
jgi:hypothetical protein